MGRLSDKNGHQMNHQDYDGEIIISEEGKLQDNPPSVEMTICQERTKSLLERKRTRITI